MNDKTEIAAIQFKKVLQGSKSCKMVGVQNWGNVGGNRNKQGVIESGRGWGGRKCQGAKIWENVRGSSKVVGGSTKEVGCQNMGKTVGDNQKWQGGKKWQRI